MHRRWRFRGAQEEFVDIGFVEAVFVVAQIIANDDGAAFFERTVNFVATKGEQHGADLLAVFRNIVVHRLFFNLWICLFLEILIVLVLFCLF